MGCAFGAWNKTESDLFFVLRSNGGEGIILKLPKHTHKIVRMQDGEIVTSFIFGSLEEAEASVGVGEKERFTFADGG